MAFLATHVLGGPLQAATIIPLWTGSSCWLTTVRASAGRQLCTDRRARRDSRPRWQAPCRATRRSAGGHDHERPVCRIGWRVSARQDLRPQGPRRAVPGQLGSGPGTTAACVPSVPSPAMPPWY